MGERRRLRAAIFDLDGTLADTFPLIVSAWNAAMTEALGRTYTGEEVIARFGIPDAAMIARELGGDDRVGRAVERYYAAYEAGHGVVRPFAGIDEMLAGLGRRGVKLGLMTGKGRRTCEITVRALGWEGVFGAVVCGEDVARQKPDPEGVLSAAERLGVEAAGCAFVGDAPADVGAGKGAGMVTVWAGWHPVYEEKVRGMGVGVVARSPGEVVKVFE